MPVEITKLLRGMVFVIALFAAAEPYAPASVAPMPVISRDCPAYASDTSYPPAHADDASYDTYWRSGAPPTKESPAWLACDLSAAHPGRVAVVWFNDTTYGYDYVLQGQPAYSLPRDYTIDVNSAPGGKLPSEHWVTKVTVAANTYHSRLHFLDMKGFNWIRLRCTAAAGSPQNEDVCLQMDVHDASRGTDDTWMFLGDSIDAGGMALFDTAFARRVNEGARAYFPCQEDGGIGGATTDTAIRGIDAWLKVFPGRFVALDYGTNDVNTFAGDEKAVRTASANLRTLAEKVLAAGKTPIIPHMPWAPRAAIESNGPALNAQIDRIVSADPRILAGPDLYTFFREHPKLIGGDRLHPASPDGYQAYRDAWARWALRAIYAKARTPVSATRRRFPVSYRIARND